MWKAIVVATGMFAILMLADLGASRQMITGAMLVTIGAMLVLGRRNKPR